MIKIKFENKIKGEMKRLGIKSGEVLLEMLKNMKEEDVVFFHPKTKWKEVK